MEYRIIENQDVTEIALIGCMRFSDHTRFREVLGVFDREPGHSILFDLANLDFVDSTGLGLFLIARDEALQKGLQFGLRRVRGEVKRMMDLAKFHKHLDIHP